MFESLSDRLGKIFDGLRGRGALSEADVDAALREIRRALIEADVSLEVVRAFVEQVRDRAIGVEVTRSVTPGQQVVKIVHDELVGVLGEAAVPISLNAVAPVTILMVGLQGSGKTTTTAKIAKRFKDKQNKKVLLASLDTRRPAAMEQLRVLGEQVGVATLPIVVGENPVQIARRAAREGKLGGFDILILDTAGRTHIDEELMAETAEIKAVSNPHEVLLVVDALTGQDAVNLARSFDARVDITGIVMTRVDGDGRGGAALSMRAATGKPIKLIGTGEKMDALEDFHPSRIADRILGMGDIVSLVERAAEHVSAEDAQKMAKKLKKGSFDLDDLRGQLQQMKKMGGMNGLMAMMPGVGQMKKAMANSNVDEKVFDRQIAIIGSMTKKERAEPDVLNASRRKRIASGAGVEVSEINKLIKQHRQMADMMKKVSKGGMGSLAGMFGGKMGGMMGGMPDLSKMDPKQLEAMARQAGIDPKQLQQGMGAPAQPQLADKLPTDVGALFKSAPGLPGLGGAPRFPRPSRPGQEKVTPKPRSKGPATMSLKIRLARGGTKKRPFYHIVVADARSPRDGRFIEKLGTFNPLLAKDNEVRIVLNTDRAKHWLEVGAQPTDRVLRFLDTAGLLKREARNNPEKAVPGAKATERAEARTAAAAAAEAAKNAPKEAPAEDAPAE